MKLSDLFIHLLQASEFNNPNSLAKYTGETQMFCRGLFLQGDEMKESMRKMDNIMHKLTPNVSAKMFIEFLRFLEEYEKFKIEKEQIL